MTVYYCNPCKYETGSKFNFSKHFATGKHLKKCRSEFSCYKCLAQYKNKQNLSRHENNTCDGIIKENKIEEEGHYEIIQKDAINVDELIKKNTELQKTVDKLKFDMMQQKIDLLEKENKDLKSDKMFAGKIIKKLTDFQYIKKAYPNAPEFTELTDDDIIKAFSSLEKKNLEYYKKKGKNLETCFSEQMVHYFKKNAFEPFVCNLLCHKYKKVKNPEDQAIWTIDASRLNYSIRNDLDNIIDNDDDNSESESDDEDSKKAKNINWIEDKQGTETKKKAIKPILNYIKNTLHDYVYAFEDGKQIDCDEYDNKKEAIKIIDCIKTGKAEKKVLKLLSAELKPIRRE